MKRELEAQLIAKAEELLKKRQLKRQALRLKDLNSVCHRSAPFQKKFQFVEKRIEHDYNYLQFHLKKDQLEFQDLKKKMKENKRLLMKFASLKDLTEITKKLKK